LQIPTMADMLFDVKSIAVREICKQWTQVLHEHAGTEVPITSRGKIVAYLRVLPSKKGDNIPMPDFKSRIKARFGSRTLTAKDVRWLDRSMRSHL
jgi:hypothetical protein